MFRIFINFMIENERMKKYFINFKTKDYLNRDHVDVEKATKRRDLKTRTWHYIIICQTYQLHDEKNERKNLRRVIFETSTIKINEVFNDICVIQSKSRVKSSKEIKNIKFIKIAKDFIFSSHRSLKSRKNSFFSARQSKNRLAKSIAIQRTINHVIKNVLSATNQKTRKRLSI
jgi:hypothetical protein